MEIEDNTVVTMHYTLTGPDGAVLDSSEGKEPMAYLHGHGNIIPGLEKQLSGKQAGDKVRAEVPCGEAYGEHDPDLVVQAQRSQFPEGVDLEPGMRFQASTANGQTIAEIKSVEGDNVTVDTNHPLAGVDLTFDVDVVAVRAGKADEIEHGHVH
jgi:FKBP-type peptidyl-prolyl cis-trans isomerase SlyD